MSHIIFHSTKLTDVINEFIDKYEELPANERKKIIIDSQRFAKMAHINATSPESIIAGIFTATSILAQEVIVTIPWDKNIFNVYKSLCTDDSIPYEAWFTSSDNIPNEIDPNKVSIKNGENGFNIKDFNRKIESIDVMYIISIKTLTAYEDKVNENEDTCIQIDSTMLKDIFNIKKEMKPDTRINIISPQIGAVTWSDYFKCIEHFLIDNESNKKIVCIEDMGLDHFVNMMRNIFEPYKSKIKIITSCKTAVKFI